MFLREVLWLKGRCCNPSPSKLIRQLWKFARCSFKMVNVGMVAAE